MIASRRRTLTTWLPALLVGAGPTRPGVAGPPVVLTISGRLHGGDGHSPVHFTLDQLARLPQHEIRTSTPWHTGQPVFRGALLREVLATAGARCQELRLTALNDFRVDIPADEARRYDVILAHLINGRTLGVRDKGPLFLMYPFDRRPELRNSVYYSRCIWQLRHIRCR